MAMYDEEMQGGWRSDLEMVTKTGGAFSFFKDIVKKQGTQQVTADCTFCWKSVTSTGASRLAEHLADKCVACPKEVKVKFQELKNKVEHKRKLATAQIVSAKEEMERDQRLNVEKKQMLMQLSLPAATKVAAKEAADKAIARFFYANGLPFFAASHEADSYYREMISAVQKAGAGYLPPGAKAIGGKLIDDWSIAAAMFWERHCGSGILMVARL
ncbi:hypothetical protein AB1Y20_019947 [Prymnesium parvum]|uniref:BED-type domain-containing protein n=1 Tax=Prymnesium parvum TaxID=97485 RepID=A0AB34JS96_PRYPA